VEDSRADVDHRPVGAVHDDPETVQRGAEPVCHELDIALSEPGHLRDRAGAGVLAGGVEKRLDRLLLGVLELEAVAEELDAVVLGGVVGGGDDRTGRVGEERDRRRGKHPAQGDARPAAGEPRGQRALELGARAARVAADEDFGA
jgi:hypothetical protein